MINMLSSLFRDSGYIKKESNQGLFYSLQAENKKSFWFLVKGINLSEILDKQSDLFKSCQDICDDPDLDKNLSLLVLSQKIDDSSSSFKQIVLDIEEDPYLFRKYVLQFSHDEITQLTDETGNKNISDFIIEQLSNKETFQTYKDSPDKSGWQSLIYKIAIKLPFIALKTEEKVEISSLWKKKEQQLNSSKDSFNLTELDKIIFDDSSFNSIDSMEPKEVLNLLLPNQDNE